jgi:hypothetical protein
MMAYGYANASQEVVSHVTATNTISLGERRMYKDVEYVYCYNQGNSDIPPGYGVIASLCSGYSVTLSSAAGDKCFGVCVNVTATTATYFWLAQKGFVKVVTQDLDSANVAGECIRLEDNGAFQHVQTGATGNTWSFQKAGYLIEDVATAGSGLAYIRCP